MTERPDSDSESVESFDSEEEEESNADSSIPTTKSFINNVSGLEAKLEEIQQSLAWVERLDLTTGLAPPPHGQQEDEDLTGERIHDDFKREMKFYRQAQAAVLEGMPKLYKLGIKTRRPEDYFAEMAKTDAHMKKVREKLLSKQAALERSEKAKKLRELRKFGKKVQQEVLQKRSKEKKDMLEAVKKYRKGKQDKLDFLEDPGNPHLTTTERKNKQHHQKGATNNRMNKKRDYKNKKFGFGGQKKRTKYNTKDSSGRMKEVNPRNINAKPGQNMKGGNKNKRPGKRRRQTMKGKKR